MAVRGVMGEPVSPIPVQPEKYREVLGFSPAFTDRSIECRVYSTSSAARQSLRGERCREYQGIAKLSRNLSIRRNLALTANLRQLVNVQARSDDENFVPVLHFAYV